MKSAAVALAIASVGGLAAATPEAPLVTPRAQLAGRQDADKDPALLGWVSGEEGFSSQRSCDFPATLSVSNSLAQCCAGTDCIFWSSCSAGTLFAPSTSLRCDVGYCNTAILVPTPSPSKAGDRYIGCWPTAYGEAPFTIVGDIGTASPAAPTSTAQPSRSSSTSDDNDTAESSATRTSSRTSASSGTDADETGSATDSASGAASSTAAAAAAVVRPLTGVLGLGALFLGIV